MSTPTLNRPSQILLPFAEKEWISVHHTMRILNIGDSTLYRLRSTIGPRGVPYIEVLDCGHGKYKRVRYASVVAHCDYLRELYGIPDRRPPLASPILRHRPEDLLPFPVRDTIGIRQAIQCSPYQSDRPIHQLIAERAFEAYQILPAEGYPWRISRSSFAAWLERSGLRLPRRT